MNSARCIPVRFLRSALLGTVLLAGAGAVPAEPIEAGIAERYPNGAIRSLAHAEQALRDVRQERARLNDRFAAEEIRCYERFFVNMCRDDLKQQKTAARLQLRQVESEASKFMRRARADAREQRQAARQARKRANASAAPQALASPQNITR